MRPFARRSTLSRARTVATQPANATDTSIWRAARSVMKEAGMKKGAVRAPVRRVLEPDGPQKTPRARSTRTSEAAKCRVWPELPSATGFGTLFGVDQDALFVYAAHCSKTRADRQCCAIPIWRFGLAPSPPRGLVAAQLGLSPPQVPAVPASQEAEGRLVEALEDQLPDDLGRLAEGVRGCALLRGGEEDEGGGGDRSDERRRG